MSSRPYAAIVTAFHRVIASLALLSVVMPGALTTAQPAFAVDDDPAERLEFVIKSVHIYNASEDWTSGDGEISISVTFSEINPSCPDEPACLIRLAKSKAIEFSADDGDTKVLNRVFPMAGDTVANADIGNGRGIPVYPGKTYWWQISGEEEDTFSNDELGHLEGRLSLDNSWGPPGTYDERGTACTGNSITSPRVCGVAALYSVVYEVRKAPLPDLKPMGIRVVDATGTAKDVVCLKLQNVGPRISETFGFTFLVDNVALLSSEAVGLDPGESSEPCLEATLPTSGRHQMSLVVDDQRNIAELDENNNRLDRGLDRTPFGQVRGDVANAGVLETSDGGTPPSDGPGGPILVTTTGGESKPGGQAGSGPAGPTIVKQDGPSEGAAPAGQADLALNSLRLKSGNNSCKEGKNDVVVQVKNVGAVAASNVLVRLQVDDDTEEKTVPSLGPDKEETVAFEDVRMKKGERHLTASVNPSKSVSESSNNNNELKQTVDCKDDD